MRSLLILIFLLKSLNLFSQNTILLPKDSMVVIDNIFVSGNKKTKTYIILREMFFKQGDTIATSQFAEKLEQSKQFIFNTTLFVDVNIQYSKLGNNKVAVIVLVKERWYIFPLPYFKLVDRNFNDWWVNQNRDFSRVNYGVNFVHNNLSGTNDKLNIQLITGYNRQISLRYELPFSNKKLTNGFSVGFTQSKQKELNYLTSLNNKQLFYKETNGFAKSYSRFDFAFIHRPDKFSRHIFRIGYSSEEVSDSVIIKNPDYYGYDLKSLNYINFSYSFQYLKTNYNAYPTNGFGYSFYVGVRGLEKTSNLNQIIVTSIFAKPINKKIYFRARSAVNIKFPYNPYFINQALFGSGDFQLRGMEYYVVDGMFGLIGRFNLGYDLGTLNLKLPVKNKTYNSIPFKFYGKIHTDVGYCYNPYINNNLFNNKALHTYGIGLDIVTIYDIVFKLEYSFNQLGQKGLYIGN
jgi:outer membrane protein assembly factor BamA